MICNLEIEKLILLKDFDISLLPNDGESGTVQQKELCDYCNDIDFLNALALQNEYVVDVRSFETKNARVFGILTLPIYLKSEREKLLETLTQELSQGKPAYVTFDNDIFRKIKPDMTEEKKSELLDLVQKRANKQ